jgi:nucleotide-binding universal stress UspA family protein
MPKVQRVLVPVDFSDCSRAALDYAALLAAEFGADIDVLHVWESPLYASPETMIYLGDRATQTLADFARTQAGKLMEELMAKLVLRQGVGRVQGRLESGRPFQVIVSVAQEGAYDLVVMGTHGRTGFSRLATGSVAERVVRMAPCPVLTVRAPNTKEHT